MRHTPGITGSRRLHPLISDYSYYLLRRMRKAFEAAIETELAGLTDGVIVDLGCGDRPYEALFRGRVGRYVGADLAGNPLADVEILADGTVPLETESADVVLSSQMLAHVVDADRHFAESFRILKAGGVYLVSTNFLWVYHPHPLDMRRWSWSGLEHDLKRHDFEVESITGCLGPLAYTTLLRLQLLRGFLYGMGRWLRPVIGAISAFAQILMVLEDWITPGDVRFQNACTYVAAARKPSA